MSDPFISVAELADALSGAAPPAVLDASLVLLRPRFDGDYRSQSGAAGWVAGHVPGSLHVDVATQFSDTSAATHYAHPSPQRIADELARLGIAEGREVVVYDSTGTLFAARLWYLLSWIGVTARVLDGGFAAWQAAGQRVEIGDGARPRSVASWRASEVRAAWVSVDELVDRAADDPRPLVCALAAGSFTGADPTRYARRGRIPGSINVAARDLFTFDGFVTSRTELVLAYRAAGIDLREENEILLYCGGGISAAANALTLAAIGTTRVRIYDESLEEWAADPALPLAVGDPVDSAKRPTSG